MSVRESVIFFIRVIFLLIILMCSSIVKLNNDGDNQLSKISDFYLVLKLSRVGPCHSFLSRYGWMVRGDWSGRLRECLMFCLIISSRSCEISPAQ